MVAVESGCDWRPCWQEGRLAVHGERWAGLTRRPTVVLLGVRVEVRRVKRVPDSGDVRRCELFHVQLLPREALGFTKPRVVHDVVDCTAQVAYEMRWVGASSFVTLTRSVPWRHPHKGAHATAHAPNRNAGFGVKSRLIRSTADGFMPFGNARCFLEFVIFLKISRWLSWEAEGWMSGVAAAVIGNATPSTWIPSTHHPETVSGPPTARTRGNPTPSSPHSCRARCSG